MSIVVVDDDRLASHAIGQRLRDSGFRRVRAITDPQQAMAVCAEVEADLVVSDVHMPRLDGLELLKLLRTALPDVPVLLLTADEDPEVRRRAFDRGASDFLMKSANPLDGFLRVVNLLRLRTMQVDLRNRNRSLEQHVQERTRELEIARGEILERLALAAEYRDDNTQQHALRIGATAARLAEGLGGDETFVTGIRRAAALHDIGKIAIPDAILLKQGPLEPQERELMQTHTTAGALILSGSTSALLRLAEEIALSHHERWDGTGYPNGLAGEQIPLPARIVAVADVFDALAHARPYKPAWPVERAVQEILSQAGRQFDPAVVSVFGALDHHALLDPQRARTGAPSLDGG